MTPNQYMRAKKTVILKRRGLQTCKMILIETSLCWGPRWTKFIARCILLRISKLNSGKDATALCLQTRKTTLYILRKVLLTRSDFKNKKNSLEIGPNSPSLQGGLLLQSVPLLKIDPSTLESLQDLTTLQGRVKICSQTLKRLKVSQRTIILLILGFRRMLILSNSTQILLYLIWAGQI